MPPYPEGGGGENISQCPVGKKFEKRVEKKGTPLKKAENRIKVRGQLKLKEKNISERSKNKGKKGGREE
jgi:hypothetical protein